MSVFVFCVFEVTCGGLSVAEAVGACGGNGLLASPIKSTANMLDIEI